MFQIKIDKKINILSFGAALLLVGFWVILSSPNVKAYAYTASWTSPVKSYASQTAFGTVSWDEITATNSSISVDIRVGDTTNLNDETWMTVTNGQNLAAFGVKKNIQSRITFSYDGPSNMPGVSEVRISSYSGQLTSSIYDTRNYSNKLMALGWHENIAGSSNVLLQARTSSDKTNWTNWCGPDNGTSGCDNNSWFTDPNGGEAVDNDFKTSDIYAIMTSDRYIQYRIMLFSDGINIPIVDDVTLSYDRQVQTSTWTSPVKDTGQASIFGNISWTENIPVDTSVSVDVRAGNTAVPDGTWITWTAVSNNSSLATTFSGYRYIQHRINFSSFDINNVLI